ncbi:MAG TPA: NAD(P)H-dependent oxidoreductase [Steroidobacteraceae bacterium]|nr:NAD(P)H-dependent oxidoreductase [Steroidobacteraceae bacterium]
MPRRILIIEGHPDADAARFGHALVGAYRDAALAAGHDVRTIAVGKLDFPLLRTGEDFQKGGPVPAIAAAQRDILWAEHLVIFYPLWFGSMPAFTKAFFEQCLRPGFAFEEASGRGLPKQKLKGRSARVVVTMGMPGFFYKWFYRAHSLKSFERNILRFCGIAPVRDTVVGMVESAGARKRALAEMKNSGTAAR